MIRVIQVFFILMILFSCVKNRIKTEYYSDGSVKKEVYYSNYEVTQIIDYYKKGGVYSRTKFSNFKKGDCAITIYSSSGRVIGIMNYSNGVKHGKFIWYNTKGKLIMEENYIDGVLIN